MQFELDQLNTNDVVLEPLNTAFALKPLNAKFVLNRFNTKMKNFTQKNFNFFWLKFARWSHKKFHIFCVKFFIFVLNGLNTNFVLNCVKCV